MQNLRLIKSIFGKLSKKTKYYFHPPPSVPNYRLFLTFLYIDFAIRVDVFCV
jgi:hypothetical protein